MSTDLTQLAKMVDHTVDQAEGAWAVRGNEAARVYGGIQDTVDNYRTAWNASFTGACIAALFLKVSWLESFSLDLCAESEYDDQGGTYRSISLRAPDATVRRGATVPSDVLDDEGEFCEDLASDWIQSLLEDDVTEIYNALVGEYSYEEVMLEVQRDSVTSLLESGKPVSGLEAFALLFPEYAWRAKPQAPSDRREPSDSPAQQDPRLEEYLFDARLLVAVRVRAASQEEARGNLGRLFDRARCHVEIDADSGRASPSRPASTDRPPSSR